jgi:hypothetical protein
LAETLTLSIGRDGMGLAWTKDDADEKQLTITRGNGPRAREKKSRRVIRRACI